MDELIDFFILMIYFLLYLQFISIYKLYIIYLVFSRMSKISPVVKFWYTLTSNWSLENTSIMRPRSTDEPLRLDRPRSVWNMSFSNIIQRPLFFPTLTRNEATFVLSFVFSSPSLSFVLIYHLNLI